MEPVLMSVEDAAEALGVKRTTAFDLIRQGKLKSVKLGARRLVLPDSVTAFARELIDDQVPA